jgi:hypothetical protein
MKNHTLVRVAFPKNIRKSKAGVPHPDFGKEITLGDAAIQQISKGKTLYAELGRLGLIKKEDFIAQNISPYGLTAIDCQGFKKVESDELVQLKAERDALLKKLETNQKTKKNEPRTNSATKGDNA